MGSDNVSENENVKGGGDVEMREHLGAGWRMYFIQHGGVLIVMLGGGDKSSQSADITRSIQ